MKKFIFTLGILYNMFIITSAQITKREIVNCIENNKIKEAKKLIDEFGPNKPITDSYDTALHFAVGNQRHDLATWLIQDKKVAINAQNSTGQTPLHLAVATGNLKITKFLVDAGADINTKAKNEDTPLTIAILKLYVNITEYLLENKVNAHITYGEKKYTPLHLALLLYNNTNSTDKSFLIKK